MAHYLLRNITLFVLGLLMLAPGAGFAAGFSSQDGAFTMDMPAGWKQAKTTPEGSVLSIEKNSSRIDIKTISCTTETCIEKKISEDLADVKRKKMQVVGNSYTGEEIKRIEFSTGEPFFYINFFTPKNDFGAGYFLINSKAYSILAKDLTYAETDLIFSFISPVQKEKPAEQAPELPIMEMDLKSPKAYDIAALPDVQEETLSAQSPEEKESVKAEEPQKPSAFRKNLSKLKVKTLLSKNMPPYVRQLGRGFDIFVFLLMLFGVLLAGALIVRFFIPTRQDNTPANPNSLFPIRFRRLYGTPSLIFRARDNQGNVLISLSSRWDSLFLFTGSFLIVLTFLILAVTGLGENSGLLPLSAFAYNTIYSACSLLIPLGLTIFFCGVVWSQLVLREITLFDRKGKKAAIVLQKGFGFTQERYEIYFARSKDVLVVTRKRFSFCRQWQMFNREGNLQASLTESSAWRALARKACGHLWGMLRADYKIQGQMDSTGTIENACGAFDRFTCYLDKPQALNARDLLAVALLINIRDRDKWYPWFN